MTRSPPCPACQCFDPDQANESSEIIGMLDGEFEGLAAYLRDLYQTPGVAQTVDFDHIKRHYYMSHEHINPTRIVPIGPALDYTRPHGRESLGAA